MIISFCTQLHVTILLTLKSFPESTSKILIFAFTPATQRSGLFVAKSFVQQHA